MSRRTLAAVLLSAAALAACGGGGGSKSSNSQPNRPPVVNPGQTQNVLEQRTVTLAGSATDPDGNTVTLQWTQDGGPPVTLANANTATATFTSPAVSAQAIMLFRLTATDSQNAQSFGAVNVIVDPDPLLNVPPIANAGPDMRVAQLVERRAIGSGSDPDGSVAGYLWTQVAGPAAVEMRTPTAATLVFVSPPSSVDVVMTFELRVTDNEGVSTADRVNVTVVANNLPPVVNAGPDQVVLEQRTVTLSGSATDPDGTLESVQWTEPFPQLVTLDTPGNPTTSFQSPAVSSPRSIEFMFTATDDLGTRASDFVRVVVNPDPALNTPPVANAGPDRTAATGVVVPLVGEGNDTDSTTPVRFNWTQLSGPAVTITNATFQTATFMAPTPAPAQLRFQLTVTDEEGATASDTVDVNVTDPGPLSGRISYDKVPFSVAGSGLDYNSIIDAPVRGAVVEAIDAISGINILATTTSDANGNYSFIPPAGRIFLRVKAQMVQSGTPAWSFRVVNNTNGNALYAMQSGENLYLGAPTTLNLRAPSGWSGRLYTQERVAAPFSLLDVAYEVKTLVLSANPSAQFAPLTISWSPANFSSGFFDPSVGAIITTSYTGGNVYVLGDQEVDTDEYDQHVIAHELGHYFQDVFSRDDSIGGPHGPGDLLDLRVAFSEGWGNAFSGMVKNDPRYRDSFGPAQASDFDLNVESDQTGASGWYSEESVQSILYDVFDATSDANDGVTLGFAPIFQVLSTNLPGVEPLTSIFPFASHLKANNPSAAAGIDAIVSAEQIVGTTIDELGSTETNNGGNTQNLAVYRNALINGGPVTQVCSSTANGEYNRLGNAKFLRFNVPSNQTITIRAAGPAGSDPDMSLYRQGLRAQSIADSTSNGVEQFSIALTSGNYILEVYDFFATDSDPGTPGNTCMSVTITSP